MAPHIPLSVRPVVVNTVAAIRFLRLQVTVDLAESQQKTAGSLKDLNTKITAALADLVQASPCLVDGNRKLKSNALCACF